jgi:methionyl-tRNA formyltransferase
MSDAIVAATGDGLLAITELQPEGRRPMAVRDFLAGHPVRPGMTFKPPRGDGKTGP